MRIIVKFYYRKLFKIDNLNKDLLFFSDIRRLDEIINDKLIISNDKNKYDFIINSRRVNQRPRTRNKRIIINNRESDKLIAE